jgi:NDP-sugar pyrophosphorylase family protein
LRRNDLREVYVTTGYLGHIIKSFCGDGSQWDMKIEYTEETEPRGTIGPLTMLKGKLDSTFLVINGDVLSDLSLNAFAESHFQNGGLVTVATSTRKTKMDFGVIEHSGGRITQFKEKPHYSHQVSMGVYCMEPAVLDFIPNSVPFGFDDLILSLLRKRIPAHTFVHEGMWLDIGRVEDFHTAQELTWDDQPPAFEAAVTLRSEPANPMPMTSKRQSLRKAQNTQTTSRIIKTGAVKNGSTSHG